MKNCVINKDNYKLTTLGWIPKDWEILKLSQLGTFAKGKGILREQLVEQGLPCVRYGEIYTTYNYYAKKFNSFIDAKTAKESKEIKCGDILFAGSGETLEDIGKAIAYVGEEKAYAGGDIIIFTADKKIDTTYLSFSLNMPYAVRQKSKLGQGNSIVHLYPKNVGELEIFIPSEKEQQKISNILILWDKQIVKTENLISAKEKLKKGLMQQLLTGKKRLKGFNGQWKKVKLFDLVKEIKRPAAWSEEKLYDLLSIRRRSGGVFYRESLYGNQILTKGLYTTKEKDFLISKMQIVHGASGLVKKELDGMYISGSYIALAAKDKTKLDMNFFDWFSKTRKFYNLCYTSSYGVHIEKMTFDFHDFLNRSINIPTDINEQVKIAEVLEKINGEIKLLKEKVALLKQQKKGLMQVLLTGKVRVKI